MYAFPLGMSHAADSEHFRILIVHTRYIQVKLLRQSFDRCEVVYFVKVLAKHQVGSSLHKGKNLRVKRLLGSRNAALTVTLQL